MSEPEPGRRPCKYCRAPLVFVRSSETGKVVPLQPVPSVYVIDDERDQCAKLPEIGPHSGAAVNHWATCPKAAQAKQAQERKKAQQAKGDRA